MIHPGFPKDRTSIIPFASFFNVGLDLAFGPHSPCIWNGEPEDAGYSGVRSVSSKELSFCSLTAAVLTS